MNIIIFPLYSNIKIINNKIYTDTFAVDENKFGFMNMNDFGCESESDTTDSIFNVNYQHQHQFNVI